MGGGGGGGGSRRRERGNEERDIESANRPTPPTHWDQLLWHQAILCEERVFSVVCQNFNPCEWILRQMNTVRNYPWHNAYHTRDGFGVKGPELMLPTAKNTCACFLNLSLGAG